MRRSTIIEDASRRPRRGGYDDYSDNFISRHDNIPRFDELEKEVVKLVKATFNVK